MGGTASVPSDYSFSGPVNKENYGTAQRPSLPKMNEFVGRVAEARASQDQPSDGLAFQGF